METKNNITQIYDILGDGFRKLDETIEYLYPEIKNGNVTPSQIVVFENICEAALKIINSQREILIFSETYLQDILQGKLDEKEMEIRNALLEVVSNSRK